ETGRFISQDPIGHQGGTNLYQYALNNPTTYTDPTGNNPMLIGCAIGAVVDAAWGWYDQKTSGRKVNWGSVASWAAIGCLSGMLGHYAACGNAMCGKIAHIGPWEATKEAAAGFGMRRKDKIFHLPGKRDEDYRAAMDFIYDVIRKRQRVSVRGFPGPKDMMAGYKPSMLAEQLDALKRAGYRKTKGYLAPPKLKWWLW
ncbi:RHS repeat-associated core domain-containing protein, partial [Streptomyces sp.]|uniref:RHS repeat-associated core domain-containing protein n=1 Tax=Streptomyces sp. TaxID=1931 RepID=UPI002F9467F5